MARLGRQPLSKLGDGVNRDQAAPTDQYAAQTSGRDLPLGRCRSEIQPAGRLGHPNEGAVLSSSLLAELTDRLWHRPPPGGPSPPGRPRRVQLGISRAAGKRPATPRRRHGRPRPAAGPTPRPPAPTPSETGHPTGSAIRRPRPHDANPLRTEPRHLIAAADRPAQVPNRRVCLVG
jgi:hypothetical protein